MAFFGALADEFSTDPSALQRLFLGLNVAPGGTALLVHMREHLLQSLGDHPGWAVVEASLAHVLKAVFCCDVLQFRRIDRETAAPILEKLIEYEAVHAIHDWREMRRRLEDDRRCYAFFHQAWPDEPIAFTEIALTRGISRKVQPILDPDSPVLDPASCDSAIFYSITSCQPGLRGFSFGNPLIGRVVAELRTELPQLGTFATLSPIQGFRRWLAMQATSSDSASRIASLAATVSASGWSDEEADAQLKDDLLALCALYLLRAKKGAAPADPVTRFHLANGARLQQINWLSDLSRTGMERSAGFTANYLYDTAELERNAHSYATDHLIATTGEIERLSQRGAELSDRSRPT